MSANKPILIDSKWISLLLLLGLNYVQILVPYFMRSWTKSIGDI